MEAEGFVVGGFVEAGGFGAGGFIVDNTWVMIKFVDALT